MRNNTKKRLAEVEVRVGKRRVPRVVGRPAFEHFKATGELPADLRIAAWVVERARTGFEPADDGARIDWGAEWRAMRTRKPRPKDSVMDSLYDEAVWGSDALREAARQVLRALGRCGIDPTEPLFVGLPVPEYGSVGMTLLDLPECLAIAPYVEQAERLFARMAELRPRLPQGNLRWFQRLEHTTQWFFEEGERPDDELELEAVLVLGEMNALIRHAAGRDASAQMAAFDAAARAAGDEREAAIGAIQRMAKEGHFIRRVQP